MNTQQLVANKPPFISPQQVDIYELPQLRSTKIVPRIAETLP